MRSLLFVLTLVTSAAALAVQPISGVVNLENGRMFIKTDDPCNRYLVGSNNQGALSALVKLAAGDIVTATGFKNPGECTVSIESVDFVGLRRMLGNWYSRDAVITVQDFNSMRFYPASTTVGGKTEYTQVSSTPVEYNYSMVPSQGKEWVLFLSDSRSTTFATIQFNKNNAVMKIFNSDSGALNKTFVLYRMISGKN